MQHHFLFFLTIFITYFPRNNNKKNTILFLVLPILYNLFGNQIKNLFFTRERNIKAFMFFVHNHI